MHLRVGRYWESLAERVLRGEVIGNEEALGMLRASADDLLPMLHAALTVRMRTWGKRVRIHVLVNARSGGCSEDCRFCTQAASSDADIDRYPVVTAAELVQDAERALAARAWKYCIVTAMRAPNERVMTEVCEAVRRIKRSNALMICCSLGLLTDDQAARLKEAGVDRYNHNLETSRRFFPKVCTTHTYDDRLRTLEIVKRAGLSTCSGGIIGMGEEHEDIVELAAAHRALDTDSIPINFLNPVAGTPLGDRPLLSPQFCLRVLALFRFLNPDKDVRVAGGREVNLRYMQPLSLYAASSLFAGGYLTTGGQSSDDAHRMVEDMGFEIEEVRE